MTLRAASRRRWALLLAAGAVAGCIRAQSPPNPQPTPDAGSPPVTTPPSTSARPAGGRYSAVQYVTLVSNRLGTVYYSVDGVDPAPNAPNTSSGTNPMFWIRVGPGTTTVKFFAIDSDGNREPVQTERYEVTLPPAVAFTAAAPPPVALLGSATIDWRSEESGMYVVELGAGSAPGTGLRLASGTVSAGERMSQEVTAFSFWSGGPAKLTVRVTTDDARTGSSSMLLDREPAVVLGPAGCSDVIVLPGGRTAYVIGNDWGNGGLAIVDIDPSSPTYRTIVRRQALPALGPPQHLAATADGTRVYVTADDAIHAISAADGALLATVAPVLGAGAIGITPDGTRAYTSAGGDLVVLDVDPASATYHQLVATIATSMSLPLAQIAFTPDGRRAVGVFAASSYSGASHAVDIVDVDPQSATYGQVIAQPVPPTPTAARAFAMSPDGRFAYLSDEWAGCGLCKIDLSTSAIVAKLDRTYDDLLAVTPDGRKLLAAFTQEFRVYDTAGLRFDGYVSVPAGELRTFDALAIAPDGTRAYATDSPVSWGACQLVEVPLR